MTSASHASEGALRFDPPGPAAGASFVVVVEGLDPGEAIQLTAMLATGASPPSPFTADAKGEVRVNAGSGAAPIAVTATTGERPDGDRVEGDSRSCLGLRVHAQAHAEGLMVSVASATAFGKVLTGSIEELQLHPPANSAKRSMAVGREASRLSVA